ncbi:MAG: hypothetical protein C5B49_01490 [Bdellovibrio sp.]|nr:MAG: hypothetical protein C5B49_01490 [Bdellovibrio sp.]
MAWILILMTYSLGRLGATDTDQLSAQRNTGQISLNESLHRSLDHSPALSTLKINHQNALLKEKNAWRVFAPTVDVQALHQYSQTGGTDPLLASGSVPPWYAQLGLSVTENLYDNGESLRQAQMASLSVRIEELNLRRGRGKLITDVAKAFYEYSSAAEDLQTQQKQLAALKVQFNSIERRYMQGLRSNRDYMQIKAQVKSSEISRINSESHLQEIRSQLLNLSGEPNSVEFEALKSKENEELPVIPEFHAEDSVDYQLADLQDRLAEMKTQTARRNRWPRLSIKGSYSYNLPQYLGPAAPGNDPFWNLQAQIILDYRLWDWGIQAREVELADNQVRVDQNSQSQSRLDTLKNVRNLKENIQALQESFRLSLVIAETQASAFASMARSYREGKVTYLEMMTALKDNFSSQQQLTSLRFNLLKAQADALYFKGAADELLR